MKIVSLWLSNIGNYLLNIEVETDKYTENWYDREKNVKKNENSVERFSL